jgi:diaminopimelate decarboxylase
MTTNHIDECLATRDGHLFIESCDTVDLVQRFGSPIFVLSENQLRRNTRRFRKAFASAWPDGAVEVLPAIKANWILATRMILSAEGAGADVYSEGELRAALETGVDPDKISVNGTQAEVLRRAETLEDVFRRDVIPERLRAERLANRSDAA